VGSTQTCSNFPARRSDDHHAGSGAKIPESCGVGEFGEADGNSAADNGRTSGAARLRPHNNSDEVHATDQRSVSSSAVSGESVGVASFRSRQFIEGGTSLHEEERGSNASSRGLTVGESPRGCPAPAADDDKETGRGKEELFWAHHAVAGAFAGLLEHLAMHPFDTIKTNMQAVRTSASLGGPPAEGNLSPDGGSILKRQQPGMRDIFDSLQRREGVFRGLFRGATAMSAGAVPAHIGFFCTYEGSERH